MLRKTEPSRLDNSWGEPKNSKGVYTCGLWLNWSLYIVDYILFICKITILCMNPSVSYSFGMANWHYEKPIKPKKSQSRAISSNWA